MAVALILEDFEPKLTQSDVVPAAQLQEEYQRGFLDGVEATKSAAERAGKASLEDIAQTLSDVDITFAEAQAVLRSALASTIEAIGDKLLPQIAQAAIVPILQTALDEAVDHNSATVKIALCPAEEEQIAAQIKTPGDLTLSVIADPSLGPGQYELIADQTAQYLDIHRITDEITLALSAVCSPPQRSRRHG